MSRRVAFVGHHGSTFLFLDVFERLRQAGAVDPHPGFITFNRYWVKRITARFPSAVVAVFPTQVQWSWKKLLNGHEPLDDSAGFERAWKLDKILRHRRADEVGVLWNLTVRACEKFLDDARPAFVFTELLQTLPCLALFRACQRRQIPFIQLVSSRIQGRFDCFLGESGTPLGIDVSRSPSAEALEEAAAVIARVVDAGYRGPSYIQSYLGRRKLFKASDIKKGIQYVAEQVGGGWMEPTRPGLLHPIVSKFSGMGASKRFLDRSVFKTADDVRALPGKKLLFALHVTPESSTDLWAPDHNDMLVTVNRILANMPETWTLVLKEHPSAVFLQRNPAELAALVGLPRTILVSPFESNDKLLKECGVILVINSTLGWEAMIKGFPVISIGHPFYELSGETLVCDPISTLGEKLAEAASFRPDPDRVKRFVAAYIDSSDPGAPDNPLMYPYALEPGNVDHLAVALQRRFLYF
jgi:hypothetical protein